MMLVRDSLAERIQLSLLSFLAYLVARRVVPATLVSGVDKFLARWRKQCILLYCV